MKPLLLPAVWLLPLLSASAAWAGPTGLDHPLTGTTAGVSHVDLSVHLDLNGAAPNVVGVEVYVAFDGLMPISSTYALGSLFDPFAADLLELHGVCASLSCSIPEDDPFSPAMYRSSVNVFAPAQPTGPGGVFALRFAVDPSSLTWSLDVLGDPAFALLADACDPADAGCVLDPLPIAFSVVTPGAGVLTGTARVDVSATPLAVPEPAALWLSLTGAAVLARRIRCVR
jgi:hypothetical protein